MSCSNAIRSAAALIGVLVAAQSMAAAPDETVCREQPRPGSHIMMRVCATPAERSAMLKRDALLQSPASAVQSAWATSSVLGGGVNTSVSISLQRY